MKEYINFFIKNRAIYIKLVQNDFKARYIGSYLGAFWGIIQPIITILIYWFVFQIGLRSGDRPDGTPYILWMIAGMIPWFFFADALGSTTNIYLEYSYMVKKLNFRISILPFVKIGSSLLIHITFLLFSTVILNFYGFFANWSYLQLIYYMFACVVLVAGITFFTSTIAVYMRDTSQFIAIVIQIGFWIIPIVWAPEAVSERYLYLFKLNPVYYIVEGYRQSLLSNTYFWQSPLYTLYFWSVTLLIWSLSIYTFRKLKPYFSDIL